MTDAQYIALMEAINLHIGEIKFSRGDLKKIKKGDFIVKTLHANTEYSSDRLNKVLENRRNNLPPKVRRNDLVFYSVNDRTVTPHAWGEEDVSESTKFRHLTEKELSKVNGTPTKLELSEMIAELYKSYSKSSNFEDKETESVLSTYINNGNHSYINRYQVYDKGELLYDTLTDNYAKGG